MAIEFEFLSPTDKPALLALSSPEALALAREALSQMDYKVHAADSAENFLERFAQVQYQIVVIEENFGGGTGDQNVALKTLQGMSMALRRHATVVLLGDSFQTMAPMQAFQQSVHAVLNRSDLPQIQQVLMQVSNENALFLHLYRDVQLKLADGKR
jgi:hypothetical protein